MLSDFHFDPFHDPAKAERAAIGASGCVGRHSRRAGCAQPGSGFCKADGRCGTRGVDTPWTLLESSLSGGFACTEAHMHWFGHRVGRFAGAQFRLQVSALAREVGRRKREYSAFAAKTVAYQHRRSEGCAVRFQGRRCIWRWATMIQVVGTIGRPGAAAFCMARRKVLERRFLNLRAPRRDMLQGVFLRAGITAWRCRSRSCADG